jgi:NADH-quinone oxidoreductase subunit G
MRVTPKINFDLNDNLISDKARFSYDSQKLQRLQRLFYKDSNTFTTSDWDAFFLKIEPLLHDNKKVTLLVNDELDLISLNLAKALSFKYNVEVKSVAHNANNSNSFISGQWSKIHNLKKNSKFCFLISSNLRLESALINAKLRLKFVNEDLNVFGLNQAFDSNFNIQFVNLNIKKLILFMEGKSLLLSKVLLSHANPLIFLGNNLNKCGLNLTNILNTFKKIAPTSIVINNVQSCNSQGTQLLNIKNVTSTTYLTSDTIICLNLDNTYTIASSLNKMSTKIIWANTHGSSLALKSTMIIPLLSELEEEKIFLNLEGRPQKTSKIFSGINNSRSLESLLSLLISNAKVGKNSSALNFIKEIILTPNLFEKVKIAYSSNLCFKNSNAKNLIHTELLKPLYFDFYRTNKASKASLIMSKCSQEMRKSSTNFYS